MITPISLTFDDEKPGSRTLSKAAGPVWKLVPILKGCSDGLPNIDERLSFFSRHTLEVPWTSRDIAELVWAAQKSGPLFVEVTHGDTDGSARLQCKFFQNRLAPLPFFVETILYSDGTWRHLPAREAVAV